MPSLVDGHCSRRRRRSADGELRRHHDHTRQHARKTASRRVRGLLGGAVRTAPGARRGRARGHWLFAILSVLLALISWGLAAVDVSAVGSARSRGRAPSTRRRRSSRGSPDSARPERGTTVNVGLISGGTGRKVIAARASRGIDIRVAAPGGVAAPAEMRRIDAAPPALAPPTSGCGCPSPVRGTVRRWFRATRPVGCSSGPAWWPRNRAGNWRRPRSAGPAAATSSPRSALRSCTGSAPSAPAPTAHARHEHTGARHEHTVPATSTRCRPRSRPVPR